MRGKLGSAGFRRRAPPLIGIGADFHPAVTTSDTLSLPLNEVITQEAIVALARELTPLSLPPHWLFFLFSFSLSQRNIVRTEGDSQA